jgi:hypothetical protein
MRKMMHDHPFWARLLFATVLVTAATFAQGQGGSGLSNYGGSGAFAGTLGASFQDVTEIPAPANPGGGVDRLYTDSTSHLLTCLRSSGANCFSTAAVWSAMTNGAGNLSITPGGTSIFNATTGVAQFFAWKNTTAALVGASQSSPVLALCGTEWHAAASVEGCLTFQFIPGTGTDAASSINFAHSGSATGSVTTVFPGPVAAGAAGGAGGAFDLPEGTAYPAASAHDNCYADSTIHGIKCSYNNGAFVALNLVTPFPASASSVTLVGPSEFFTCSTTCTITAPTPVAGYQFCIRNDDNVATVITLAALSGIQFENTARTSYKTANTSLVSGGAVTDQVCIVGKDATHYQVFSFTGTWI